MPIASPLLSPQATPSSPRAAARTVAPAEQAPARTPEGFERALRHAGDADSEARATPQTSTTSPETGALSSRADAQATTGTEAAPPGQEVSSLPLWLTPPAAVPLPPTALSAELTAPAQVAPENAKPAELDGLLAVLHKPDLAAVQAGQGVALLKPTEAPPARAPLAPTLHAGAAAAQTALATDAASRQQLDARATNNPSPAAAGQTPAPIASPLADRDRPALSTPGSGSTAPSFSSLAASVTETAGDILKLPAAAQPTQWRAPLLNALGERVQWQLQRGSEQATIRLEPPNLGRVDIVIRQEGGALQVSISATHREVMHQLQGISEQLRQDLSARHSSDVALVLSEQARDADARQRARQEQETPEHPPGQALAEAQDATPAIDAFASLHETV